MDTVFGSFWRRQKDLPLSLLLVRFFGSFWRRQKDLPPSYLMDTVFGSFWRRQKDLPLSLLLVRFLVLFVVSKKINLHSIVLCSINI